MRENSGRNTFAVGPEMKLTSFFTISTTLTIPASNAPVKSTAKDWHLRNQRLYQIRPLIAPPFAQRKFLRDIPPGFSVPLYQEKHQDSRVLYHIQRQQCAKRESFRLYKTSIPNTRNSLPSTYSPNKAHPGWPCAIIVLLWSITRSSIPVISAMTV